MVDEATVASVADRDLTDAHLAPLRDHRDQAGIITDFDGTLAPIVDDPARSRPLPEVVELLHRLSHRYRRVAVVSGRPAAFIAEHVRLTTCPEQDECDSEALRVAGLYGLETAHGEEIRPHPEAEPWRAVVDEVASLARDNAPSEVGVEHKGLSLVLHYRTAPDQHGWVDAWAEEQADRTGLALHPGRMSQELRPPIDTDKGTSMTQIVEELQAACFVGDDKGDLPAFEALDRLAKEKGMATLKVAVKSEESPPELLEACDVEVDGPDGVVQLFRRLL
jgi:trehalose 6-phosphate phosphatase